MASFYKKHQMVYIICRAFISYPIQTLGTLGCFFFQETNTKWIIFSVNTRHIEMYHQHR